MLRIMPFSVLCEKEVVNCRDGKILGTPVDLRLDTDNGTVLSLIVRESGKLCLSPKYGGLEIRWDCIEKIGNDIILVHVENYPPHDEKKAKKEKKSFFGS